MSQREKPKQKKVCFECGKEEHLSPDYPLGHMPKDKWWMNKQSGASAHQKARCVKLADLKSKEREEQQEVPKEDNTSKKTVKWSGSQIRGPLPIRKQTTQKIGMFQKGLMQTAYTRSQLI